MIIAYSLIPCFLTATSLETPFSHALCLECSSTKSLTRLYVISSLRRLPRISNSLANISTSRSCGSLPSCLRSFETKSVKYFAWLIVIPRSSASGESSFNSGSAGLVFLCQGWLLDHLFLLLPLCVSLPLLLCCRRLPFSMVRNSSSSTMLYGFSLQRVSSSRRIRSNSERTCVSGCCLKIALKCCVMCCCQSLLVMSLCPHCICWGWLLLCLCACQSPFAAFTACAWSHCLRSRLWIRLCDAKCQGCQAVPWVCHEWRGRDVYAKRFELPWVVCKIGFCCVVVGSLFHLRYDRVVVVLELVVVCLPRVEDVVCLFQCDVMW